MTSNVQQNSSALYIICGHILMCCLLREVVIAGHRGGNSRLHVLLSFSLHRGDACTWSLRFVHRKALIVDTKVCMPYMSLSFAFSEVYIYMVREFWLHREVMIMHAHGHWVLTAQRWWFMHAHGHWVLTAQRGDDACTWSLSFDCTGRWDTRIPQEGGSAVSPGWSLQWCGWCRSCFRILTFCNV